MAVLIMCSDDARAVTRTWDNGGGDGLWSTAANWSGDAVPTSADAVVFDATSTAACTIDVSPSVLSVTINATYTGVVSLGANTLTLTSGFVVATASTFNGGTGLVKLNGNVTVNSTASVYNLEILGNGTITALADLAVTNNLTITAVNLMNGNGLNRKIAVAGNVTNTDVSGFTIGSGWFPVYVSLNGSTDQHMSGAGGIFNYLDIDKSGGNVVMDNNVTVSTSLTGTASAHMMGTTGILRMFAGTINYAGDVDDVELYGNGNFTFSQDLIVLNNLTITLVVQLNGNAANRKIKVAGNVINNDASGFAPGSGWSPVYISLNGSTDQHISGSGGVFNYLDIDKSGGNVVMDNDVNVSTSLTGTASAHFIGTTGILRLSGTTVSLAGDVDDVELYGGGTFTISQDLIVLNTLNISSVGQLNGNAANRKIKVAGDVTNSDAGGFTVGSGWFPVYISLNGSADQTVTGVSSLNYLEYAKTGGNGNFQTASVRAFTTANLTSGTWNLQGNTFSSTNGFTASGGTFAGTGTFSNNVICNSGSGIAPGNSPGCITINGNLVMNSGSTLTLEINGATPCTDFDQLIVNGTVTLNNPTLASSGATTPVTSALTIIDNNLTDAVTGTFNGLAGGSTVVLGGNSYKIAYNGGTGNDVTLTAAQEMNVQGNSQDITDGSTTPAAGNGTYFGNVNVSTGQSQTFTIQNIGGQNLSVTGITVSGAQASEFVVSGISFPTTVAAGGSATFQVAFTPGALGLRNATISIANNDSDENPYDFSVQGNGVCTNPAFTTCPGNLYAVTDPGYCTSLVGYTVAATAAPTPALTYAFTGATTGSGSGDGLGTHFNKGVTNVTITATNLCSATTCEFTITVDDTENPVAVCQNKSVALNAAGTASITVDDINNGSHDNCGAVTLVSVSPSSFACGNVGGNTVTLTVKDGSNNQHQCTATVTVSDNIAPTVSGCPTMETFDTDLGSCTHSYAIPAPTISDNCNNALTWGYTLSGSTTGSASGIADGTNSNALAFNKGVTTVTLSARDASNNNATVNCSFTVTVNDMEVPVLAGPGNLSFSTDASACTKEYTIADPITDNCSGANWSYILTGATTASGFAIADGTGSGPIFFNKGVTTVTLSGEDAAFNEATGISFTITVSDDEVPVLTAPADQALNTAAGSCAKSYTIADPINDNCAGATWSYTLSGATTGSATGINDGTGSGTVSFNKGVTTVTLNGVDAVGNNAVTKTFTVTVTDNIVPTITCPTDVTVTLGASSCVATGVSLGSPMAEDNCPGVSTSNNAPSSYSLGATTVTWTAMDASSLTANCDQTVTVIAPEINIKGNGQSIASGDNTPTTADDTDLGGTVPGSPVTHTFTIYNNGTSALTVGSIGVSNTTDFSVGVLTPAGPIAIGGNATFTVTFASGTPGIHTGTVTVNNDDCNEAAYTFDVKGEITCTFPVFSTCPGNLIVSNDAGACTALVNYTTEASAVPSPAIAYVFTGVTSGSGSGDGSGSTFNKGVTTVTVTATNPCGPENCIFTITVNDTENPVAVCQNKSVALNAAGTASITVDDINNGSHDNCGAVTLVSVSPSSFACGNVGGNIVTLTVKDGSNNQHQCTATVTVSDNIVPTITGCPTNGSANTGALNCNTLYNWTEPTSTDNCSVASFVRTISPVNSNITVTSGIATGLFDKGVHVVTYTSTDANNLVSTCQFTITISDVTAPTITGCPGNQTVSNTTGQCGAAVTWTAPTASDNCPGVVFVPSHNPGQFFSTGATTVTYTATDAGGLSTSCQFTVTVNDTEWPTITCPTNMTTTTSADGTGNCTTVVNYTTPVGVDNCTGAMTVLTGGLSSGSAFPIGITATSYQVTDGVGHTATCMFTVTVNDNEAPVFSCPTNQNVNLNSSCQLTIPNLTSGVTVTENCGSATLTQLPVSGTVIGTSHNQNHIVTLKATDSHGNTSTCVVTLTAKDVTLPTVSCPANQTITPGAVTCTTTANGISAVYSDNCSGVGLTYSVTGATTASGSGQANGMSFNTGVSTVTYKATDAATLSNTCTFTVTVLPCISVSGTVRWEHNNAAVKLVTTKVSNSGGVLDTKVTGVDGTYNLVSGGGGNLTITPTKNVNLLNGVTIADATRIQQHVTGALPLVGPYKRIAADVNRSNSINTTDASLIVQALGGNQGALAVFNTSWRFVPTAYTFPNPNVPWGFPETISLTNVTTSQTNQDFIAMKLGDVDGTSNPTLNPATPLVWLIQDQLLTEGEEVSATFTANQFNDIASYQFALDFDPSQLLLEQVMTTNALDLTMENFGTYNASEGELRAVWSVPQGRTLAQGSAVFTLKFKALQGGVKLSEVLHLEESALPAYAFNTDLSASGVTLVFLPLQVTATNEPEKGTQEIQLLQNRPNPLVDHTTIGFVLPQDCEAELRILDMNGRVLAQRRKQYAAGYQEEVFLFEQTLEAGILYYELTTPYGKHTRKMIAAGR